MSKPIKTAHVYPPIPIRTHDWCAYYDDTYPEDGLCGWGKTESEAILDLMEQETEQEDE